jgi:hypothetical protein
LVLAVAPLLAIFHRASVRHAVCEHGDLIESVERRDRTEGRGDDARSAESDPVTAGHASFQEDFASSLAHGHSHCSVSTLAKSGAGFIAPAPVIGALGESFITESAHREIAYLRRVLVSAPKTSPPITRAELLS